MPFRKQLCMRLSPPLAAAVDALDGQKAARLEEIRVYAGRNAEFVFSDECRMTDLCFDTSQMDSLLAALCGYALYSCEHQIAEGFIPLEGGHRAGVCGRMTWEDGRWHMNEIVSICIRISHDIPGASCAVRPCLLDCDGLPWRTLLLGPPGCGKTTVLRDAAIWLSEEKRLHVAVADEREELFGTRRNIRMNVLCGSDKAHMLGMLLRSMAPQVIVTDEIGKPEDADALLDAARCGVGILASAHARSMEEAMARSVLYRLFRERVFDRYLLLGNHGRLLGIYDAQGKETEGERHDELGYGGDGHGFDQHGGHFALGR